jgi:hypothetical protein
MNRERSKSNFVAFRSEELRVNSEEFWYAFLMKSFLLEWIVICSDKKHLA